MQDGNQGFARYPSLQGRVALITGGATGIGESMVAQFARQGARVAFFDVQDAPARLLVETLTAERLPAPLYLHCDLTDVGALKRSVEEVIEALGTVDVLVNNAANDQRHTIEEVTPEYWDKSISVNLRPQFFMIQAVIPAMRKAGHGSIINMSSIIATTGYNGLSVYGATKAAATGFTRSLAREVGKLGITVNAIAPGFIDTELTGNLSDDARKRIAGRSALRRLAEVDDVARMVEYLLGDGGRNITGSVLTIDAGNTA